MSEKPTKRISELLDIFNSAAHSKTAAEVDIADALDEDSATAAKAEVGTEQEADEPSDAETTEVLGKNEDSSDADPMSEEDDGDAPAVIIDTTDAAGENDPADDLASIAKEASEKHYGAIKKEAMLFGEIFADSFEKRMRKTAEEEYEMDKYAQIQEEAYDLVMQKLAEGEMGGIPMQQPMPDPDPIATEAYNNTMSACDECANLSDASEAVNTSAEAALEAAKAAKSLVEAIQEENEAGEEEGYEGDPAAEEAYAQAMAAMQGGEGGQPAADPVAEQAYAQAMQQIPQQPMPQQGMY